MCDLHWPEDAIATEAQRIRPLLKALSEPNRQFVEDVLSGATEEDLAIDHTGGNLAKLKERYANVFYKSSLGLSRTWSHEEIVAILLRARTR